MFETMTMDFSGGRRLAIDHLRFGRVWIVLGIAMVATVVVLSLIAVPNSVGGVELHDKAVHLFVYATLMSWFAQVFRHDLTRLMFGIGLVVLGVMIEFLQGMTPSRQFEILDMIANGSGVLLAWALSYTRLGELLPTVEKWLFR